MSPPAFSTVFFSIRAIKTGERTPKMHITISTQQIGVEKRTAGLPPDSISERRRPFSPSGPRISANTTAAGIEVEFAEEIAEYAEDHHNDNIHKILVNRIGTDDAEHRYARDQNRV